MHQLPASFKWSYIYSLIGIFIIFDKQTLNPSNFTTLNMNQYKISIQHFLVKREVDQTVFYFKGKKN